MKNALMLIYGGGALLVAGLVLLLAKDNSLVIVIGAGQMIMGAARVSVAASKREDTAAR